MENAHQAILDSLPLRRRRSKLEPYAALIRALRARGRSYREIVTILRERCGLRVALHTVYHFARAPKHHANRRPRGQTSGLVRRASAARASPSPEGSEDLWARIAAVKRRAPPPGEPKAFVYDEDEPLQLMTDVNLLRR
jgi:hypothetical protein